MELAGKQIHKKEVASRWRWAWGGWRSQCYDELEQQPWTPIVVGGALCFTVRERNRWAVVVGDACGKWYDDAFDVTDYEGQALYVARDGGEWMLVLGRQESQRFDHQVTYIFEGGRLYITAFAGAVPRHGDLNSFGKHEPIWSIT